MVEVGAMSGRMPLSDMPDATYTLTRTDLDNVVFGQAKINELVKDGRVEGAPGKAAELPGLLDSFDFWFDIVTPNPNSHG